MSKKIKDNRKKKPFYKKIWFWILVVLVVLVLGAVSSTGTEKKSTTKTAQHAKTEKISTKSSSEKKSKTKRTKENLKTKKSDAQASQNSKNTKIEKANTELKKYLADEVESFKKGDSNYEWSMYVDKMTLEENGSLRVDLNASALTLSKEQLLAVSQKSQQAGMAALTIADSISQEDMTHGIYTSVWCGKRAIGHTKLSDHSTFKIYD